MELPVPYGGRNRIKHSIIEYIKYGAISLAVLFLIILYVLEFSFFTNTFQVKSLVLRSLLIGAIAGGVVGWRFRENAEDLTERIQLYIFFIIIFAIFSPLFGSLSNRLLSFHAVENQEVEFVEETSFASSPYGFFREEQVKPEGYYIFFYWESRLKKIESKISLFPDHKRGEKVFLPIQKGLWGYDFVRLK